jgi:hypothetical protein
MTAADDIDRIAPTVRPRGRAAMHQRWSRLLFLHWPIPTEELRPLIPRGLALDTYAGQAWVGLVYASGVDVEVFALTTLD